MYFETGESPMKAVRYQNFRTLTFSLRMNFAGILTHLQPPPPKTNIRFQPYLLTQYDHEQNIIPERTGKIHLKSRG